MVKSYIKRLKAVEFLKIKNLPILKIRNAYLEKYIISIGG